MRSTTRVIFATAFMVLGVFAGVQTIATADNPIDGTESHKIFPVTYLLTDLPVWSPDGKTFNSTLLQSYIKAKVDAKAWDTNSTMVAYPQNSRLVVATTLKNHDAIQALLTNLRAAGVPSDTKRRRNID